MWKLVHKQSPNDSIAEDFDTRGEAEAHLTKLGPIIERYYRAQSNTGDPLTDRLLTEGMVQGDLYKILLPRISVDEFVPGDPETDNIVIAFFLKGVPEATLPFKTFCEQSNGVINADYGDSETVIGAQNVYVEFDRENIDIEDIDALMIQAAMLSSLESEDFTMTFPHTDKKFPYDATTMKEYFISRNEQKNRMAQQAALDKAAAEFENDLQRARASQQSNEQDAENQQQAQESLVNAMANVALTG
jgi:Tfp pilus assembly protein PilE